MANRSPELIWIFVSRCKRQSGGKFRPANRDVTVVPLQNRPSQFRNFSYFGNFFTTPRFTSSFRKVVLPVGREEVVTIIDRNRDCPFSATRYSQSRNVYVGRCIELKL